MTLLTSNARSSSSERRFFSSAISSSGFSLFAEEIDTFIHYSNCQLFFNPFFVLKIGRFSPEFMESIRHNTVSVIMILDLPSGVIRKSFEILTMEFSESNQNINRFFHNGVNFLFARVLSTFTEAHSTSLHAICAK